MYDSKICIIGGKLVSIHFIIDVYSESIHSNQIKVFDMNLILEGKSGLVFDIDTVKISEFIGNDESV